MTNPNDAVGTNGAYNGRTSVNAFNDIMGGLTSGVLSGWVCSPKSGMTVSLGGDGSTRDVAIAEDNAGNKTSINNISGQPIDVTIPSAPATGNRIDLIVAYVENPPQGDPAQVDNFQACGLITVSGTAANSPVAPGDGAIRSAITADGATGATAYYVVLAEITVGTGVTTIGSGVITQGASAQVSSDKIDFATSGAWDPDGHVTATAGTVYYKRVLPNVVFLYGSVTPSANTNIFTLPFTSPLATAQTFTCFGGGLDFTKAFIAENSSNLGFTKNTNSSSYALNAFAILT